MGSFRDQATVDRFEKRRIPRFPVQLPATIGHEEADLSSICTNLSSNGVSIETSKKVQVGQKLFVQITLASGQSRLKMQGLIVWKRKVQAMDPKANEVSEIGIRFIRPLPSPWKNPGEQDYPMEPEYEGFEQEDLPDFIPFKP
ncbi:MAG: PilZ domain-containing protein [Bdellovibrionales bacterium]|nr:PilZ domain-containing protein [Bdellovibrionales bacterium]